MAVDCREYYEVLGVAKNATPDEIRTATASSPASITTASTPAISAEEIQRDQRSLRGFVVCRKTRSAATRSGQLDVGEELRPLPGCEDAHVQQNHSFAFRLSG
jgi:hypothetical protein